MKPQITTESKNDENFLTDVQRLLAIREKIINLQSTDNEIENINIISEIGELCRAVTFRESDKESIRNKYGKRLDLESLKSLSFLNEEFEKGFINAAFFVDFLPLIKSDLLSYQQQIDNILIDEEKRIKEVFLSKNIPIDLSNISKTEIPANQNSCVNVKSFIASYYLPRCFRSLMEATQVTGEFNWESLVDRYFIGRTFALIGETAKEIRNYTTGNLNEFFNKIQRIRNTVKEPTVHQRVFVEFLDGEEKKYSKIFDALIAALPQLRKTIEDLDIAIADLPHDQNYSAELAKILNITPSAIAIFESAETDLRAKKENPYIPEFNILIADFRLRFEKLEIAKENKSNLDQLREEYEELYKTLSPSDREKYKFPANFDEELIKQFVSKKVKEKPSDEVVKMIAQIRKIKTFLELEEKKISLNNELNALLNKYKEFLDKIAAEKKLTFEETEFPKADLETIEEYIDEKNELKTSPKKMGKYCFSFNEETVRLNYILESNAEKRRQEFAVAHSVGIVGETIRNMLEIDEEHGILSNFTSEVLRKDIDYTRFVRNKHVMHGKPGNNDSEIIFGAALNNTIPWNTDILAVGIIRNWIKLLEKRPEFIEEEAQKHGVTVEQFIRRTKFYIGDAYLRLGKNQDAKSFFEEVRTLSHGQEEYIHASIMLAVVAREEGDIPSATNLLNETLSLLDPQNLPKRNIIRAQILNNLATILVDQRQIEEAKSKYHEAISLSEGDGVQAYSTFQLAGIIFKEGNKQGALDLINSQIEKRKSLGLNNLFESIMLARQKWVFLKEMSRIAAADEAFKEYKILCERESELKAAFGYNFKTVAAIVLQDEADNFYCQGQFSKAIPKISEALEILKTNSQNGELKDIRAVQALLIMGNSYKSLSAKFRADLDEVKTHRQEAEKCYVQALAIAKSIKTEKCLEVAYINAALAEIKMHQRKKGESEECFTKAKEIFEAANDEHGKKELEIMMANCKVIDTNWSKRKKRVAENYKCDVAQDIYDVAYAQSLMRQNKHAEALPLLDHFRISMQTSEVINPAYASALSSIFICNCKLGHRTEALRTYDAVEKLLNSHPDCIAQNFRHEMNNLLQSHFNIKDYKSPERPAAKAKPRSSERVATHEDYLSQ